eukprot:scaffold285_cov330-Pavlova_lutheri.AAC.11
MKGTLSALHLLRYQHTSSEIQSTTFGPLRFYQVHPLLFPNRSNGVLLVHPWTPIAVGGVPDTSHPGDQDPLSSDAPERLDVERSGWVDPSGPHDGRAGGGNRAADGGETWGSGAGQAFLGRLSRCAAHTRTVGNGNGPGEERHQREHRTTGGACGGETSGVRRPAGRGARRDPERSAGEQQRMHQRAPLAVQGHAVHGGIHEEIGGRPQRHHVRRNLLLLSGSAGSISLLDHRKRVQPRPQGGPQQRYLLRQTRKWRADRNHGTRLLQSAVAPAPARDGFHGRTRGQFSRQSLNEPNGRRERRQTKLGGSARGKATDRGGGVRVA